MALASLKNSGENVLGCLRFVVLTIVGVVALGAGLFWWLVYTPNPPAPELAGAFARGQIAFGGHTRSYYTYVPRDLPTGAPLIVVMHGSGVNAAHVRAETAYEFDRLADTHHFAVVYPNAFEGYWNACNVVGDYSSNKFNIDDVGFLTALADKLATEVHIDPARVFAAGVSRGGAMAYRLALEAPERFRAVAAVASSVPTPDNSKCTPPAHGVSSVMIMNGTADPLNPFNGGEVRLYGFLARGTVLSSQDSARYFSNLAGVTAAPTRSETPGPGGMSVERFTWRSETNEVDLVAIHGGGHAMPQPYRREPRLLGPTPRDPNGPAEIVAFFERQRAR